MHYRKPFELSVIIFILFSFTLNKSVKVRNFTMSKQEIWNKKKFSKTFRRRVIAHRNILLQQISEKKSVENVTTNNLQIATLSVPVFETDGAAVPETHSPILEAISPPPDISKSSGQSDDENSEADYYSQSEDDGLDDYVGLDDFITDKRFRGRGEIR